MPLNMRGYEHLATDAKGETIAAGREPAVQSEQVTVGNESAVFEGKTYFLMLHAEEDVRLEFGESPSAGPTSTHRLVAGQTSFVGVKPGHKLDTAVG